MYDEWLEIDSPRIAPLFTKQDSSKADKSARKKAGKAPAQTKDDKAILDSFLRASREQKLDVGVKQNGSCKTDPASASTGYATVSGGQKQGRATPPQHSKPVPAYSTHFGSVERQGNVPPQKSTPRVTFPAHSATAGIQGHANPKDMKPVAAYTNHSDSGERQGYARPQNSTPIVAVTAHLATSSSLGRAPIQIASQPPQVPVGLAVAKRQPSSPVRSVGGDVAMHIPNKKKADPAISDPSASSDPPVSRIPRKTLPILRNPDLVGPGLTNGASFLQFSVGMTPASLPGNPLAPNYFQPNRPGQLYQAQSIQGPPNIHRPDQLFDTRSYWQGQQQFPRNFGGPPSNKRYDGRR